MKQEETGSTTKQESPFSTLMAALTERIKNTRVGDEIEYPVEVAKVRVLGQRPSRRANEIGSWAAVRPCADEHAGKTYLGVYLGDLLCGGHESYNVSTKEIDVALTTNPAIYVPDLKKIIWGMESWWGVISSPDKLQQITDKDIQNVWYVRALEELSAHSEAAVTA